MVQADSAQMLAAAKTFGASDWLFDVRRRDTVTVELSAWCSSTFYPQAASRLAPRRLRLAVLSSPAMSEIYRTDPDQKKFVALSQAPSQHYDIDLFNNEGEAMQWLRPSLLP
ncbi:hypothetical protein GCM10023185_00630 [Hymenobacter saemangeumensis]|uniref:STAS/SEC14 domain-containing protein n=1 Tax=Hymenobacter saemangeumensis TaxID=1084522 RepID=A0ABP8HWT1_9BACT